MLPRTGHAGVEVLVRLVETGRPVERMLVNKAWGQGSLWGRSSNQSPGPQQVKQQEAGWAGSTRHLSKGEMDRIC